MPNSITAPPTPASYGNSGAGHAEMNALEEFLKNACGYNAVTFGNSFPISIFCEEKPCCYYCSAMMGLLGIVPRTSQTRKNKKRMGKTQWGGLSLPSLQFVATLMNRPRNFCEAGTAKYRRGPGIVSSRA